jgi:hypothetical protein
MPPLPGFAKAEKRLEWPPLLDWNTTHPVMRYVNFGNVTVAEAQAWTAPKTARVLVEAGGGPLMVAVENDRMRVLGVAFDFFKTDWAYRPSLPLFLRNVVPWLAESSPRRHPTALHTGEPLVILPGLGAPTAKLQRPGNEAPEEVALSGERSVFVKGTETAGLYRLKYEVNDAAQERAYAVNLASRDESDNAARGRLKIGDVTFESTPSAIEAKREIWRDLVLAAAVLLLLEWWVFHRRVGM